MNRLVNDDGILNIEDLLMDNPTYLSIVGDNIVTKDEKLALSSKIVDQLKKIDELCSDEQVELVRQLMADMCAFVFVCSTYPESE